MDAHFEGGGRSCKPRVDGNEVHNVEIITITYRCLSIDKQNAY